jgi:hypothetical protein
MTAGEVRITVGEFRMTAREFRITAGGCRVTFRALSAGGNSESPRKIAGSTRKLRLCVRARA